MSLQAADCAIESLCSCRDNKGRHYYVWLAALTASERFDFQLVGEDGNARLKYDISRLVHISPDQ